MDHLTDREQQIVALLIEGCRNKDIARRFGTREQTVKNQLTRIYEKTGTHSRLELVLYAMRRGQGVQAAGGKGKEVRPAGRAVPGATSA